MERERRNKSMDGAMELIDQCRSLLNFPFLLLRQTFTQRYGYKNAALDAKEKAKLQAEILELVFAHGEHWRVEEERR